MTSQHREHRTRSRHRAGRRLAVAVASLSAIAAAGFVAVPAVAAEGDPIDISLVTINDFHGRIEANGSSAGAAVLAGAVEQVRAQNPNTIFAAAGDLIGASTFTSFIQQDNPTIDALNAAGLDVSATGNHEFDQGFADLRDRVIPRAKWTYLNSNVFLTATGQPAITPSWVKDVAGVRVGFVGAVTEDLSSLVSPAGMAGLEVRDIATSVNTAAHALRDGDLSNGEADLVILLVHEGATTTDVASITPESRLGEIVNGVGSDVNAIVSAHTHLAYNHTINGRPVISAGQYGENIGVMDITVDPTTKSVISMSNQIKPLVVNNVPQAPADPTVAAIVDTAKKQADTIGNQPVGSITAPFNRARPSSFPTVKENRGGESTLGNFVADVQKWSTGADLSLMNPGGLRDDLAFASSASGEGDGVVTFREAAAVQPFANTLVTLRLTGDQLKQVLEQQWQPSGAARPFLKLGVSAGLQYTYDPGAAAGSHVTRITLNGTPIDPAASYRVGVNSFLAAGGDNFTAFTGGTDTQDTGRADLQSMVEWFALNKTATPDLAQRSIGVALTPAPSGEYWHGDQVTLALSSLAFTGGEPAPGDVSVSLGGTTLATTAVDPKVVDAYDEAGRATLSFAIPVGVTGPQTLHVSVAGGGTAVDLPITVAGPFQGAIDVGSGKVAAGAALAISGSGFHAGHEVTLQLLGKKGASTDLGSATIGADGAFATAPVVPKDLQPGKYTLTVTQANGDRVTATVTVNRGKK